MDTVSPSDPVWMTQPVQNEPPDDRYLLYNCIKDLKFLHYGCSIEQVKPSLFDFPIGTEYTEVSELSDFGLNFIKNFLHIGLVNASTAGAPFNRNRILVIAWPQFVSPSTYENRRAYLPGMKKIKTMIFRVPESVFLEYSRGTGSRHDIIVSTAFLAPFEDWKLQERMMISSFHRLIYHKTGTELFGNENVWKNFPPNKLDAAWKQLIFICCGPQSIANGIKRLIKRSWARSARMAVSEREEWTNEDLHFCEGDLLSLLIKWSKFPFENEEFLTFLNKVNSTKPILQPDKIFEMAKSEFESHADGSKRHKCQHCAYSTDKSSNYSRHIKKHTDDRPFKCTLCDQSFRLKENLLHHNILHTGIYPFDCDLCGRSFVKNDDMQNHISNKHNRDDDIQCYRCSLIVKNKADLKKHMLTHANDALHQCSTCARRFDSESELQYHMLHHTDDKPFKCPICGKGLMWEKNLKSHLKVHSDSASFDCEFCDKSFKKDSNRRRHQLVVHKNSLKN